jgi:Flp pilus assembly protein TadD
LSEVEDTGNPDPRGRRLLVAAAVLGGLYLAGASLPRHPEYDFLFGLEAFALPGIPALLAGFGLVLVLLARPAAARAVSVALGRLVDRIPFRIPLLVGLSGVAFFALTSARLSGDAAAAISTIGEGQVRTSNALTCYLQHLVDTVPGASAYDAVRIVSVASGLVYVPCAVAIGRECFRDRPRRVAMTTLLLTVAPVALFFGSIEVYAPMTAALALYLLVGIRHLKGQGRGILPPIVLGAAFCLHGSAGLLLPSLVLLSNNGRIRPLRVKRWFGWGALFLVPVLVVFVALFVGTWDGSVPDDVDTRYGSFLGGMEQGPLLPLVRTSANLTSRYAMFDLEHLIGVLNLYVLASPVGLVLLLIGRPRRGGTVFRWILVVAAFLVIFPIFWNVNYSLRRDWDLFSPMGVPIALLGGLAFLRSGGGRRRALGVGALALLTFVPFAIGNTGDRYRRQRYARTVRSALMSAERRTTGERREELSRAVAAWQVRVDAHDDARPIRRQAALEVERGDLAAAIPLYRRVLEIEPRNDTIRTSLGFALWQQGQHEEAREILEHAVRITPHSFRARMNLATSYIIEGRLDDAIPLLERTVRYGCVDDGIIEALDLLEMIWRKKGDLERAETMSHLARERLELRGR